jgi:hypothetical protein
METITPYVCTLAAYIERKKNTSSLKTANSLAQNISQQWLRNKNIVQQIGINCYTNITAFSLC